MSKQRVVYIAGPFRAENAWEIEQNIRRAESLALVAWRAGFAVICPHANTRFFQGAAPDETWLSGDLALLARCDAMILVAGWHRSEGSRKEVEFALNANIPVYASVYGAVQGVPIRTDWLREFIDEQKSRG